MIDKDSLISVTNRDNGSVGYTVPDGKYDIVRKFQRNETKKIPYEELELLMMQPGGRYTLENLLKIEDPEAVKQLLHSVEPEYNYSVEDIKNLLLNGSLEQLEDCLDFAPAGVINLVKDIAVELELNDYKKREAITKKTGFNITSIIEANKVSAESEQNDTPTTRRTEPMKAGTEEKKQRKTAPPKYEILD